MKAPRATSSPAPNPREHHAGGSEAQGYTFEVLVLDGTADGELAGLTGSVEIAQTEDGGHTAALVYDLP